MINNIKSRIKKIQLNRGFTVLESMVAIIILSLSITSVFSVISNSIYQANIARDEMTSSYLAQEALEIVRNIRDTNQLKRISNSSITWLDNITGGANCLFAGASTISDVCRIGNANILDCGGINVFCPNLSQNNTTAGGNVPDYQFSDGPTFGSTLTNLRRELRFQKVAGNADDMTVTVNIYYKRGITTRKVTLKTDILSWAMQ